MATGCRDQKVRGQTEGDFGREKDVYGGWSRPRRLVCFGQASGEQEGDLRGRYARVSDRDFEAGGDGGDDTNPSRSNMISGT